VGKTYLNNSIARDNAPLLSPNSHTQCHTLINVTPVQYKINPSSV